MLSDARIPTGRLDGAVPALVADEVAGGYGGGTVLHGVSLRLARGEMLAVLGRNGSGKSTLLRLLAGALSPQAGTVLLEGLPLAHWSRRLRAQRLAVVAQELHVPFAFSIREVVELGRAPYARLLQGPHEDDRRAVAEALAVADLAGLADRPYQQLSGGEQQRVAIAMALAQEPSVLLLDEPTVHLDIAHQMAILALVRRLCATRGLAVLAAMHDINLACLYFDRMLVLADGTLVASGSPDAVVSPALVERAFGARVAVGRHPRLAVPQVSLLP